MIHLIQKIRHVFHFIALVWACLGLVPAAVCQAQTTAPIELRLLNWNEYIDAELLARFGSQFNAVVKEVYFDDDNTRDDILVAAEGKGFDLVMVDEVQIDNYRRRGWLTPLDPAIIPNLRHLDPRWINAAKGAQGYGVPYFWGTLGIGYRSDLVGEPLTRWRQFFEPAPALQGKIALSGNSREVVGMALKALGFSVNSQDLEQLRAVERLLIAQKPYVRSYDYVSVSDQSDLISGRVVAAMMYNGDALLVQQRHPNIVYCVPQEGGGLWVDYLVVMASSTHPKLAMRLINFIHEPENAAHLAQTFHQATPNRAAEQLLPADFLANRAIYPDPQTLADSEMQQPLPPRTVKTLNRIYANLLK
ncbi:MAG: spermidine/putrescine ABC transporter substrate-binding protein [Gammaproteobacteria bacterium]